MYSLEIDGVSKLYFNECANDLWIREIVFPGKREGYFVEAGAANGVAGSSCYMLEWRYAWRGICIEPNDSFFKDLCKTRPRSIHENVCLANESGAVDYVIAAESGADAFLSGVRDALLTNKQGGHEVVAGGRVVSKPARRLSDILCQNNAPRIIEYGAFDIEGSEFETLRSFPFDEYRFLALSLEIDSRISAVMSALLESRGYRETANPFNRDYPSERYWLHESMNAAG